MPRKTTIEKPRQDQQESKASSTQAGEFVREEIDEIRAGKHGARSAKQAIAIGLSKARRAGVKLPPPREGTSSAATRKKAARDTERGQKEPDRKPSAKRSRAVTKALQREETAAASPAALSRHAHAAAGRRTAADRSAAAQKAARTKGAAARSTASK